MPSPLSFKGNVLPSLGMEELVERLVFEAGGNLPEKEDGCLSPEERRFRKKGEIPGKGPSSGSAGAVERLPYSQGPAAWKSVLPETGNGGNMPPL